MALGPGKHDELSEMVRRELQADGVVLIVVGGPRAGASVKANFEALAKSPSILRAVAMAIEVDIRKVAS